LFLFCLNKLIINKRFPQYILELHTYFLIDLILIYFFNRNQKSKNILLLLLQEEENDFLINNRFLRHFRNKVIFMEFPSEHLLIVKFRILTFIFFFVIFRMKIFLKHFYNNYSHFLIRITIKERLTIKCYE
jgi:hypothetical protein